MKSEFSNGLWARLFAIGVFGVFGYICCTKQEKDDNITMDIEKLSKEAREHSEMLEQIENLLEQIEGSIKTTSKILKFEESDTKSEEKLSFKCNSLEAFNRTPYREKIEIFATKSLDEFN